MKDRKMRRSNREATADAAREILRKGEYGVLSTVGEDGFPYGVPLNYSFDGEKIYFHCAKNVGHKLENLSFCNRVSFAVVCGNEVKSAEFTEKFESVIAFGTAQRSVENKIYGLELLIKKYSPMYIESGMEHIKKSADKTDIFEIDILKISGKIHD